jgi:Ca2+:H+ antiporter
MSSIHARVMDWTVAVPVLAVLVLILAWGRALPALVILIVIGFLAEAVLAAVHHAEVVPTRQVSHSVPQSSR